MLYIIFGTRPEIIKLSPVIRECLAQKIPIKLIHSNQHYDKNLDSIFFDELNLPQPDFNLNVGSGSHAYQTGEIMKKFEAICLENKPKMILVHGDTNTTLAGGIVARKLNITLAHVEAGLRSFDLTMPEEVNRILVDRISDYLFAPTPEAKSNLLAEGIKEESIYVVGNTISDAVLQNQNLKKPPKIKHKKYILMTAHRPANVDTNSQMKKLIDCCDFFSKETGLPIIWPVHPRSKKRAEQMLNRGNFNIQAIDPVGYLDMLALLKNATYVLTDSGGVQEEAYILKRPLITLRTNTERPETLSANVLVGLSKLKIKKALDFYLNDQANWSDEVYKKNVGQAIVTIIKKQIWRFYI